MADVGGREVVGEEVVMLIGSRTAVELEVTAGGLLAKVG